MILDERGILLPRIKDHTGLLKHVSDAAMEKLSPDDMPVRFVITRTDEDGYQCELGVLSGINNVQVPPRASIFSFKKRDYEETDQFNAVLIVPTGIGASLGGHSGDAGPVARLLGAVCDNLITHPNVVNAADINEIPENALYVEGSVLSRLLMGTVGLQKVRSNRVMLVVDEHHDRFFHEAAINAVSAARAALGLDCPLVVKMDDNVLMRSFYSSSGRAVGRIECFEQVCAMLKEFRQQYDAVALASLIEVPEHSYEDYFRRDIDDTMVNPWGGIEAMLTHTISLLFDIPSAHSPLRESRELLNLDVGVVDPRKSAEAVSITYLHCILKGLHRSPRIVSDPSGHGDPHLLTAANVSCLVIPDGCVGLPTLAALEQGIPVIAVRENKNRMQSNLEELPFARGKLFMVENYLEAVGVMLAMKAGVAPKTVRRPLAHTTVYEKDQSQASEPLARMTANNPTE